MKLVDESMKALSRTVLDEARSEAKQILEDAKTQVAAIQERAKAQAEAQRVEILEKATQDAERIRGQAIASAQVTARTLELKEREKLLNEVFEASLKQLPSIQQRTDYGQIVKELLHEALVNLETDAAKTHADETTRGYLNDSLLDEIAKELKVKVTLGENLENVHGIIVETMDGHRQYDNTLESRLERMQNSLRSPVFHLLMGESQ